MPIKVKDNIVKWTVFNRTQQQGLPVQESSDGFSHNFQCTVTTSPNLKDYIQRIRNHTSATTHMDGIGYTAFDLNVGHTRIDRTRKIHIEGADEHYYEVNYPWSYSENQDLFTGVPATVFPSGTFNVQADAEALGRFVENARSAQTSFEGGVFAGQLKQTVSQIINPAKALRQGLTKYLTTLSKRRGNPKRWSTPLVNALVKKRRAGPLSNDPTPRGVRRISNDQLNNAKQRIITETWLEYVYGWRPLISDISGAILHATKQPSISDVTHVRGSSQLKGEIARVPASYLSDGTEVRYDQVTEEQCSVRYSGAVWVHSDANPSLLYGNETLRDVGLTIDNFAPTVWELIPYSFLVDYFTNIGDIISAASFPEGRFAWKERSYKVVVELRTDNVQVIPTIFSNDVYNILLSCNPGSYKVQYGYFGRDEYKGSLVPDFRISVPGITSLRWLNVGALGAQHRTLLPF
ncbi:maturation protein [ssRNA phage SRR6960803_2]|uniref:Maturation protein n=1 Tax=ssRNA phage SRR6960803_2 TaxID=2786618 RepID=A0A8S5L0S6_9VIRU|nr:maturation protein [ssRNA phage SRR6960803_2]DAD50714.1 TPA_asm: maturation protein [ssRNA phage SRR6960803_2]